MSKEIEILPPLKNLPEVHIEKASVPTLHVGNDSIDFFFNRRRWENQTRAVNVLTKLNAAEVGCINSQAAVVAAETGLLEKLALRAEAPERIRHQLYKNHLVRQEEVTQLVHTQTLASIKRQCELEQADAVRIDYETLKVKAETAKVAAQQEREAQVKYGALKYELLHAEHNLKSLDIELSGEERRALLRRQLHEIEIGGSEAERAFRDRVSQLFNTDPPETEDGP